MDWAKKRKAELEKQLKDTYSILIRSRKQLAQTREHLAFTPSQPYLPEDSGSISSFLKWFSQVEAMNLPGMKEKAETGRWVKRFTQPNTREMGVTSQRDPHAVMQSVKTELAAYRDGLALKIKNLQRLTGGLRQQIHAFEIEEENRTYGRESVRLTKVNILMSILIPISTFLAGLAASLLLEAVRPEIIHWIRALLKP